MQLIQLSDPAPIDIKKTMSTLEEALESNQKNGSIAHIENDPCAKISPSKNDIVSKSIEDLNIENTNKIQIEDKLKNLNGVVKTNGDAQKEDNTLAVDNNKIEAEDTELIGNRSSANGQNNESSSDNKLCKSPTNIPTELITDSTMDINTNLEEDHKLIDPNEGLEKNKLTNDVKITDVSLNYENSTGVDSSEKLDATSKADVCSEQENSDSDKLKDFEISVDNEDMAQNVSAFSPNSETNEKEINISAQLQQLEDDESIEEDFVNPSADSKTSIGSESNTSEKVPELNYVKPASPIQKHINNILSTTSEQKNNSHDIIMEHEQNNDVNSLSNESDTHIKEVSTVYDEKLPAENKNNGNIVLDKDLEIMEQKSNSLDISLDETSSVEDKLSMDVVNQDICDISDGTNVRKEVPAVVIENQSVKNDQIMSSSDADMEIDTSKPIQEQKQENSSVVVPDVDKTPPVPKYITVKKFTDMTYPTPLDETVDNNEEIEVLDDKQSTKKDQSQQNEVMEVNTADDVSLVTPENCILLDTSNKLPLVEKKTEVENNIEIGDKDTSKEEKPHLSMEQKNSDNVVMEIDNIDDVPALEKTDLDVEVDKDITVAEDKNYESTTKQDSIINIIDNDDEEKSDEQVDSKVRNNKTSEVISIDDSGKDDVSDKNKKPSNEVEIMDDVDSNINVEKNTLKEETLLEKIPEKFAVKQLPVVCKLSNTMDILSDDEDDPPIVKPNEEIKTVSEEPKKVEEQNKCINLDDDDDIMFIEDTNSQDPKDEDNKPEQQSDKAESHTKKTTDDKIDSDTDNNKISTTQIEEDMVPKISEKDGSIAIEVDSQPKVESTEPDVPTEINETQPLITKSFLKTVTKNLADMTRNELEDFCILKLVESVVDKSNLNEIKNKMKTMAQTIEDLRKKALALTKQNRDLQVVVKTVQEDQKKRNANPMMPMKITRSVGMQVVLSIGDKNIIKKKLITPTQPPPMTPTRPVRNMQSPKTQKPIANNIPVPRLVPASSPTIKSPVTPVNTATKSPAPARNTPQRPEKRPHSKSSPASSVTVDLTDDEPPAKMNTKNPTPPVRLVPSQNLMAPKIRPQFGPTGNSPRKVYIPISSNNQNMRPGQAVLKNFVPTPRPRQPSVVRMQTVRLNQAPSTNRHPAPLPDAMKQYQPPTWKALPPAPDLKLSKVDNGIVISWKFEGYQPETYEEVASFQLYAYQETPAPPSTALWKKIGDIKALPLPMACTLTQFMSGFKYYFAVRAIDVRSRIGPFSLPGSIMLISKN